MVLEPVSQTQPLEQDRRSKKDAKMTPQTIDNREAVPMASGFRGRVLCTIFCASRPPRQESAERAARTQGARRMPTNFEEH